MRSRPLHSFAVLSCSLFVLTQAFAQTGEVQNDTAARQALQRKLADQLEQINALKRAIAEQEASLEQLRRSVNSQAAAAPGSRQDAAAVQPQTQPQPQAQRASSSAGRESQDARPPAASAIFEQPGVLTQPGKYVLEPSLQYSYSSANRVALIGYTVVPALLVGLIDVREVKRNTMTAALSGRTGLTNRLEVDARIPYVYRSDSTVSREVGTGSSADRTFQASGQALGDIELGTRYQLNNGGNDQPFYIGTLRLKTRTGRDPFEVVTDCATRCIGNTGGTGLPLELPTGSGFYSLQGGLTWLMPSDPAVFFGSLTYLHNFKRSNVSRRVLNGESEFLGSIEPGGIVGFNFGMGLALNDKSSFSIGYDHNSVGRTRQAGRVVPGAVRTQLGTLLLGYSYRLRDNRTLSVAVGAGLTRDTPDLTLSIKLPISN